MPDLEATLAGLSPATAVLRDRVLFEAGRRSVPRWPGWVAAGAMLVVGIGVGRWSVPRGVVAPPAVVPSSPAEPPVMLVRDNETRPAAGYLRQQYDLLHGIEEPPRAVAAATGRPEPPLTRARLTALMDDPRWLTSEGR